MRRIAVVVVGTICGTGTRVAAQAPSQLSPAVEQYVSVRAPVVALVHARVLDGTGAPAAEDQTIVIDAGKIRSVGPFARTPVPQGAQVIDASGKTVIPGLFGMHDHLFYPAGGAGNVRNHHPYSAPRLYLAAGVTSIRTAGTYEPYNDLNLREDVNKGLVPGPRINATGAYLDAVRGRVNSPEDARRLVSYWADEGATGFKVYTNIKHDELKAAIEEAHKRGLKITGHLCSIGYREAVALGIDNLEHGYQVNTEWYADKKPDECPKNSRFELADLDINSEPVQATIRDMVSHKVALTSTYAVHECGLPNRPLHPAFLESLSPTTRESFVARRSKATGEDADPRGLRLFKKDMEFERAFVKAGGHLMAGLDPTGSGCSLFGFGDQRNVQDLVEAGFTPVEAIKIASYNGAQFLGQADSLGSIAPGKVADLVLIDGNLLQRIADIEKVSIVFKNGVGYDSAKLIAAVKGQVGIN